MNETEALDKALELLAKVTHKAETHVELVNLMEEIEEFLEGWGDTYQ